MSLNPSSRPAPVPRFKVTWWMRTKSRIRRWRSPLKLRGTIIRLRHNNKWPYLALLRLLLPTRTLSWKYPVCDPLPPRALIDGDPMLSWHRRVDGDLKNLQSIPIWRSRDTPLRALYRLYETAMGGEPTIVVIGYETEYFFYQNRKSWDLPTPKTLILCVMLSWLVSWMRWWMLSIGG